MTVVAQLPQILIRNSFNILGLSSFSTLKEIRKRSQQLLQFAKIEEVLEFDIDIGHVKELRTEKEIRIALERVSGVQERLKEIFFWFEDSSTDSRNALEYISKGSYEQALAIFEASGTDWLDKKNFALTLMFQAFASSSMDHFYRSLDIWKQIAESDDFWKFYEKHYLLHDEFGTSPAIFKEFKSSIFETISTIAVSFYHQSKNPETIGACYAVFGRIGKIADSEILQPIILRVKMEVDELEKMREINPDSSCVKQILKKIQKYFCELDKFDLFEYSPLIVLKNDTAEKLRSISVDIYNENNDSETARLFLDLSFKLAVSEAVLDEIESDRKQLIANDSWRQVSGRFSHVQDLIEAKKFDEAKKTYLRLDNDLASEATESSINNRVQLFINYCSCIMAKGHELFDKKKFGIRTLAISGFLNRNTQKKGVFAFEHALEVLKDRLHLLDFINPESKKAELPRMIGLFRERVSQTAKVSNKVELIGIIDKISNNLKNCEIADLFDCHQASLKTIENIADNQPNENTRTIIKLLGAAVCFSILYRRFHRITQKKMWKWVGGTAAILLYFIVITVNDKPTSNASYKNSSYKAKPSSSSYWLTSQEKEAIKWFGILYEDELKKLRSEGYSDRQIAQAILKKMKSAGYSDVSDYLLDLEKKS